MESYDMPTEYKYKIFRKETPSPKYIDPAEITFGHQNDMNTLTFISILYSTIYSKSWKRFTILIIRKPDLNLHIGDNKELYYL